VSFEAAIPELEQAVALGSNEDPTNHYLGWRIKTLDISRKQWLHLKNAPQ